MEFDVSKVYTALNADELPIGSKCYFAGTVNDLKDAVLRKDGSDTAILKAICDEKHVARFEEIFNKWNLAYLVELPKEKVVKPFETIEEARAVITAHGGFLKDKDSGYVYLVAGYSSNDDDVKPEVFIKNSWHFLEYVAQNYVFDDDGSPCGSVEGQQK